MIPGTEIGLKIDQTLTQDATGTMAYLQFEAIGIPRVKTELSVAYIDHNSLQAGFETADDHRYIQTVTKKHGIRFSRPGNGICHQVHLERFGVPGKTLIGSDSHTPTAGGIGMLGFGAGGLGLPLSAGGNAGSSLYGRRPDCSGGFLYRDRPAVAFRTEAQRVHFLPDGSAGALFQSAAGNAGC